MATPFFRVKVLDPKNNYYFMCGGSIGEVLALLRMQEAKRNDGFSFSTKIMEYMSANKKPMTKKFYYDERTNGIHFRLYEMGEIEER